MISITPFKQSDNSRCGPACIRMILDYYGIDATEDEIADRCKHTYEKGCDDINMKETIKSYGLSCEIRNDCDLADIEYWITHHIPVIVDWFTSGDEEQAANGHSSVVIGIDTEKIYLMDPWYGARRSMLRKEFERVWFDWKGSETIEEWKDMVIRQIIIPFPDAFEMKKYREG